MLRELVDRTGRPTQYARGSQELSRQDVLRAAHRQADARAVLVQVERDLRARISHADHEHSLAVEGRAALIVGAVDDASAKEILSSPHRLNRGAIESSCHDQMASAVALTACLKFPVRIVCGTARSTCVTGPFDTLAETRFDPELRRVRLEVGDDLRPRGIGRDLRRKRESRQGRIRLCGVEGQPIVMRAPARADVRSRFDQYVRDVALRQTGRRRQTGRSGADDQDIAGFHDR